MPLVESFTCARCPSVRQKSNHWWIAFPAGTIVNGLAGIEFRAWDEKAARRPEAIHLCGESCAMKELAEFMSNQAKRAETPTSAT